MAERHSCGQAKVRDNGKNGSSYDVAIATMIWYHGERLSVPPADRTFVLVIDKRALDCVMCSSDYIDRSINMYRDEVDRVLRIVDLKDEDCDSDNT